MVDQRTSVYLETSLIKILSRSRKPALILFCLSLILNPVLYAQSVSSAVDFDPPEIRHLTDNSVVPEGQSASISATVKDNVGIESVVLHFRVNAEQQYSARDMIRSDQTDLFIATLEPDEIVQPSLEYYFEATDTNGNAVLEGFPLIPFSLAVGDAVMQKSVASGIDGDGSSDSGLSKKSWLWIGLGVLAAGALASSAGGGGSGGDDSAGLIVEIPKP